MLFIQRIESKNTSHLANNKVTLQFKLAHDVGSTLTVQLLLQRPTTTADDFSAVTDFLGATTIGTCPTGTSSGTLFTYTSNTLTSADVSKGFQIQIRVLTASAVTNKNFYLGDVQLEVGDTATPFEHRSYGDELARCQRYYEKVNAQGYFSTGFAGDTANTYGAGISLSVVKRSTPTITLPPAGQTIGTISFVNGTGNYPSTTGANSVVFVTDSRFSIRGTGYVGLTAAQPSSVYASGVVSMEADAEL